MRDAHCPHKDKEVIMACRDRAGVVSEFTHTTFITSVEKSTSDSVWLSYQCDRNVSCVTIQGEVKQKLELDSDVLDISVSLVTGNLWLCCVGNNVYEASGNELIKRFTTDSWPMRLCTTPDNNVVVTTAGKVTLYSTTGQVIHSTWESGSVVYPIHVTACTSTGDIAVCDSDRSDYGGENKCHVSLFDSKLDLKHQYYGPPVSVLISDFWTNDIVYDTQGRLLIADNNNKHIQLVSREGKFLTVVDTFTIQPTALTLIQDGLLCVGFVDNTVKVIRYRV